MNWVNLNRKEEPLMLNPNWMMNYIIIKIWLLIAVGSLVSCDHLKGNSRGYDFRMNGEVGCVREALASSSSIRAVKGSNSGDSIDYGYEIPTTVGGYIIGGLIIYKDKNLISLSYSKINICPSEQNIKIAELALDQIERNIKKQCRLTEFSINKEKSKNNCAK